MCQAAYIHVPFCQDICAYCDFFRCRYHQGLADKWLFAISKEIQDKLKHPLTTCYIGGGTPSSLTTAQLQHLLTQLSPYTKTVQEYTIEANVESLGDAELQLCYQQGINRISLGIQTLQPELLKLIHRHHAKEDVLSCIQRIHAQGIHNISIDLLYGLPTQTMEQWKADLQSVVTTFDIQHISLYGLTIEPHSAFGRMGIQQMDEDMEADMYEYAIRFLQQHGFQQYEISNFAKPGFASKHNQFYWRYEDFYGIGCGASGKCGNRRYDNTRNLETYLKQGPSAIYEELDRNALMFEMVMMALRMKQGLSRKCFYKRFGKDVLTVYKNIIEHQIEKGMLAINDAFLYATEKGYPLLNDILVEFLPENKDA